MPGPKTGDSQPLYVSRRSNALQFTRQNSLFAGHTYNASQPRSWYLYSDPRPLMGTEHRHHPSKKQQINKTTAASISPPTSRRISSLVTPFLSDIGPGSKNFRGKSKRNSSSAASIRSGTSSIISRKRKYNAPPTLETLPSELLGQIFSYLDQRTLHSLILTSKRMLEEASYNLYEAPKFASTYRLAQFVTTVTHSRHFASMVRTLDISKIGRDSVDDVPIAGWREWKFRNDPLHTIHREDRAVGGVVGSSNRLASPTRARSTSPSVITPRRLSHPPPSPFLQRYSLVKDVPIGAIIHILRACTLLKAVEMSNVILAADYSVLPLGSKRTNYYPTTFTGLLYVSDVPKSFTWTEGDTRELTAHGDLVDALISLKHLRKLQIRGGIWVSRNVAERVVKESTLLKEADFRECGMYRGRRWALKGNKEKILDEIEQEKREEEEKRTEWERRRREKQRILLGF